MAELSASAQELKLGRDLSCGERVVCGGIGGPAESIEIGDNVTIGDDVRILARRVRIGDWVTINNHTTIYGYDEVEIGECSWIGQNVILNCTAPLKIGRGCTISAYSNIWTHFSGGDPLQGCRYGPGNERPCTLEDDVWIGVGASIAPVTIAEKALVMAGAIATYDIPRNTVWGGNPAMDLTFKLGPPYAEPTLEEKFKLLREQLWDFSRQGDAQRQPGEPSAELQAYLNTMSSRHWFRIGRLAVTMSDYGFSEPNVSVFDVRDRTYSKLRTPEELSFMRYLLPTIKFWARPR